MGTVNGARSGPDLGLANWSRRYKENLVRLQSGDRARIAEVVRQLSERRRVTGISTGEMRMLARARRLLDDPDDGAAGVREPRQPLQPNGTVGRAVPAWPESI
jgi:RNA polymerase-interacting CarD/CdnL/TRCF family regulator